MRSHASPQSSQRLEAAIRDLVAALLEGISAAVRDELRAAPPTAQPGSPVPPLLLSVPEAARRCGLSRSKFYGLIYTGEVPSVHIGRRRLVAETDLRDYIDRRRSEPLY